MFKIEIQTPNNQLVGDALKRARLTVIQAYALGRHLDGLKQREIAEEMGVSQQNVSAYIMAAIRKLKKHYLANFKPL